MPFPTSSPEDEFPIHSASLHRTTHQHRGPTSTSLSIISTHLLPVYIMFKNSHSFQVDTNFHSFNWLSSNVPTTSHLNYVLPLEYSATSEQVGYQYSLSRLSLFVISQRAQIIKFSWFQLLLSVQRLHFNKLLSKLFQIKSFSSIPVHWVWKLFSTKQPRTYNPRTNKKS